MALNYDVTPGRRLDASAHAVFKTRRSETHSAEIHQCMQKEFEECSDDEHRRYVHLARKHRWRGSTPVRVRFVPRTQMVLRRPGLRKSCGCYLQQNELGKNFNGIKYRLTPPHYAGAAALVQWVKVQAHAAALHMCGGLACGCSAHVIYILASRSEHCASN